MALSRKTLVAMDIPAEKIEEIITAHTETVSALKDQIETYKVDAGRLSDVEAKLKDAEKKLKDADSEGWEKKYTDLKTEYDEYKADIKSKEMLSAKSTAYRKLLSEAGVNEKRFDLIMKVTKLDDVELDEKGALKDAEEIAKTIKSEWADFITTPGKQGADTTTPPENNGGKNMKTPNRAEQLVAQYQAEHYGKKED